MTVASGKWSDGQTLAALDVTLETLDGTTLRAVSPVRTGEWPIAALRASDRLGNVPRFVYLPDGGVIETADNDSIDALLAGRRDRLSRVIHALESHRNVAAVACIVLVVLFASALYFGPPYLARAIAFRVPRTVDERAGAAALATIDKYFGQSTLPLVERVKVEAQLARLYPDRKKSELPRILYRRMSDERPNAFALPGGIIVVADELVRLPATDDEIAAVLAHEMGHLEKRHGLQSVLRNSVALLIVSGATGDLSTLTSFASALPLTILTQGYSRDLEREADAYARDLLKARNIPLWNFSSVLLKLETATGTAHEAATYFSTHPSTTERMTFFGALTDKQRAAVLAEGDRPPVPVYQPQPRYPTSSFKPKVTATVTVRFTVTPSGVVEGPRIEKSTNHDFDQPALEAVQHWLFLPGRQHFRPTSAPMVMPIEFKPPAEPAAKKPSAAAAPDRNPPR